MSIPIHTEASTGIDPGFLGGIRKWAIEVLGLFSRQSALPDVHIIVWKSAKELLDFYEKEKQEVGVVTGEEIDFFATHDAWRGYPRIHICEEKLKGIPPTVAQGIVHHEISHALNHGSTEFYVFRFSAPLQELGRSRGLDFELLQHLVYLLSVAIKDMEAVHWLAGIGLGFGQRALLEYMLSETEEEHRVWELARDSPPLRKIALAAFLKTLLPIETLVFSDAEGAPSLKDQWKKAYCWLPEKEQEAFSQFCRETIEEKGGSFQQRLDKACSRLISHAFL